MTKAEKALLNSALERIATLKSEVSCARALCFSKYTQPVPILSNGSVIQGWDFNEHRLITGYGGIDSAVEEAWSTTYAHGSGVYDKSRTGSQRAGRIYKTKTNALIALRLATERIFSEKLASIDEAIVKSKVEDNDDN